MRSFNILEILRLALFSMIMHILFTKLSHVQCDGTRYFNNCCGSLLLLVLAVRIVC